MASEAASLDGHRGADTSLGSINHVASPRNEATHDEVVEYYQSPDVHRHHPANNETLRLLSANDRSIAGLYVGHDYWIKRVEQLGKAIIKSTYLRVLEISILMTRMSPADFISLCRAVSHNRSIEHLKLDPRSLLSDVDIFPSLGLFVELNHNLRCLDISHAKNFF